MRLDVRMLSHRCTAVAIATCDASKSTLGPGQSNHKPLIPPGLTERKALAHGVLPHRSSRLSLAVAPWSEPPLGTAIGRTAGRFLLLGDGPANVAIQRAVAHRENRHRLLWVGCGSSRHRSPRLKPVVRGGRPAS